MKKRRENKGLIEIINWCREKLRGGREKYIQYKKQVTKKRDISIFLISQWCAIQYTVYIYLYNDLDNII